MRFRVVKALNSADGRMPRLNEFRGGEINFSWNWISDLREESKGGGSRVIWRRKRGEREIPKGFTTDPNGNAGGNS